MVPLHADRPAGARPQSRQFLRGDRAGRVPSRPRRAGHRLHGRSAAAGAAVLVHRHAAHPAWRRELPRAADQPAEMPDGELPARRCAAHGHSRKARSPTSRTASRPTVRARIRSAGFASFRALDAGDKVRERSETFADHYSQPRLFYRSMSEPEQRHIVNAFTFELSKVSRPNIRQRMLGHLKNIDTELCARVEEGLGMEGQAEKIKPARAPIDMKPSPALSLIKKALPTLAGTQGRRARQRRQRSRVRHRVANGRRKGRRAAGGGRAEDRRRQRQRRQADRGRSSARRWTVDLLRRRRRRRIDRRVVDAREGSRCGRLASRRVRSSESDRRARHRRWGSPKKQGSKRTKGSSKWTARPTSRRSSRQRRTGASGIASRG